MRAVTTGMLSGSSPYLAFGDGPPLVQLPGLTATHELPTGMERRMLLSTSAPLGEDFRVHVVQRKQGLQPGESMADIAGHVATAVEDGIGEPVSLVGTSTGGSVALQLAIDRPDLVRALVVVASAYRLGPEGRRVQQELARLTRAGEAPEGWAQMVTEMLPSPLRGPAQPLGRLMGRTMAPADPSDMLVTLDAEDAFDVGGQLDRVTAPTLVVGGGKDPFYPRELFEETAAGVKDGRVHIHPGWGHARTSASSATAHLALGFLLAQARR